MRLRDRQANLDPGYDNGSLRAAVYEIGDISDEGVTLNNAPSLLGQVAGLKIERGSLRETGRELQLFVGTDDESYGGTLRPLPLAPDLAKPDRVQLRARIRRVLR